MPRVFRKNDEKIFEVIQKMKNNLHKISELIGNELIRSSPKFEDELFRKEIKIFDFYEDIL